MNMTLFFSAAPYTVNLKMTAPNIPAVDGVSEVTLYHVNFCINISSHVDLVLTSDQYLTLISC